MKFPILLPLALLSLTSAAAIERRQQVGALLASLVPFLKGSQMTPVKMTDIDARVRKSAKRTAARFGPFALPPLKEADKDAKPAHGMAPASPLSALMNGMDPNGISFIRTVNGGICKNCTILATKIDVIFENGTRAGVNNGVYLHHAIFMDIGKSQEDFVSPCPGLGNAPAPKGLSAYGVSSFAGGAVDEFTDWFISPEGTTLDSGYYVAPTDSFLMQAEMVNYLKETQNVYVQMDVEYVPGKVGQNTIKTPLSVTGCDRTSNAFKGAKVGKVVSQDYTIYKDGTIISARGHMHDGGVSVVAFVNNQTACVSNADYGKSSSLSVDGKQWDTIFKMAECTSRINVKKGDTLRLEASYDEITHPLRMSHGEEQEEMGFMVFTFAPSA